MQIEVLKPNYKNWVTIVDQVSDTRNLGYYLGVILQRYSSDLEMKINITERN